MEASMRGLVIGMMVEMLLFIAEIDTMNISMGQNETDLTPSYWTSIH